MYSSLRKRFGEYPAASSRIQQIVCSNSFKAEINNPIYFEECKALRSSEALYFSMKPAFMHIVP
jgi:hypothetical protein